jgi:hypothetical protein
MRVPIDRADPTAITVQIAEDLWRRIAEHGSTQAAGIDKTT